MIVLLPAALGASSGSIEVRAGQPGEVLLDGFPTGLVAPTTLEGVAPGPHTVEIAYGCFAGEEEVEVAREATAVVELALEDRGGSGTLQLVALPLGAEPTLDGEPLLEDSATVACGPHTVAIEAPGFEPWAEELVVTSGEVTRIRPELVEAALIDEPLVFGPRDEEAFEDLEADPGLELDEEIPDFDLTAAEIARKEEEARRRAEEERRRLEAAERQARLAAYGLTEDLDAVDEEEDDDRRRRRSEPTDERVLDDDPALAALEDDPLDDSLDEDDPDDLDEGSLYVSGATYEDLEGERRAEREPIELPTRWLVVGGAGAVGATGVTLGVIGASRRAEAQATYDEVIAATSDPDSDAALTVERDQIAPAQRLMTVGFLVGGVGFAGAGGAALAIQTTAGGGLLHVAGLW